MSAKLVAMQARASPPPCLAGAGRNDLFPGSVGRRAPAGRGGAVRAVDGPSAAAAVAAGADIPPAQVTWQIVVGAVAGVTPFVVAGVEFGKRIIAQKKCEVCGGSGLVMKNDYYVRCQGCVLEKILQRLKMVMRHLDHYYQSTTTSKDGRGKKCEAK